MSAQQMRLDYQEALQLVRVGRYEESLRILKQLDQMQPRQKNILYPMAVCYERIGRNNDAWEVCNVLIEQFDHEQAKQIMARIELLAPFPEAEEVASAELEAVGIETPAESEPKPVETTNNAFPGDMREKKPTWQVLLIALVAAALVAGLLYMLVLMPQ